MSTKIMENNRLVFGPNSPISLSDIPTDTKIKERITNMMVHKCSRIYKQQAFKIFQLADSINSKVDKEDDKDKKNNEGLDIGFNKELEKAVSELLIGFVTDNMKRINDLIYEVPTSRYIQKETQLTFVLQKVTGVKRLCTIVLDNDPITIGQKKGIVTYITPDMSKGKCEPLDAVWSEGFFKFSKGHDLGILVAIPKEYIAYLTLNAISSCKRSLSNQEDDKNYIHKVMIHEFMHDITKSFLSAIFSDSLKSKFISDIFTVNNILQESGTKITLDSESKYFQEDDLIKKFREDNKKEIGEIVKEHDYNLCTELMCLCDFYTNTAININPIDFYTAFVDTPYIHIEDVLCACKCFKSNKKTVDFINFSYNNELKRMDDFMKDSSRDAIVYGIKLIKFLPVLLFNTYIVGRSSYDHKTREVINTIRLAETQIKQFKIANDHATPLVDFIIDNINYMTDTFMKQLSSPLTVTEYSISTLISAINRERCGYIDRFDLSKEDD